MNASIASRVGENQRPLYDEIGVGAPEVVGQPLEIARR